MADALKAAPGPPVWLICNKIDLIKQAVGRSESILPNIGSSEQRPHSNKPLTSMVNQRLNDRNEYVFDTSDLKFNISATSGEGFDRVLEQLALFADRFMAGAEQSLVTRARHRRALQDTLDSLRRALAGDLAGREDLLAEELRSAASALGRLTGRVDVEDVLDVIFSEFCIGK
jgi:tRNA U34 5-carboxymethylaminomethyl modifying GTPase MnmE/TrmE